MRRRGRVPLWGWLLWGLWALPAPVSAMPPSTGSAGDPGEQPLVLLDGPSASGLAGQDPAEPSSVLPAAEDTNAQLSPDVSPTMARLGICRAFPEAAVIQPVHPSPSSSGDGWASGNTIPITGDTMVQTAGATVPFGTGKTDEVPPSTAAAPGLAEGTVAGDSPQARAGVSSASPAGQPTSIPVAPATSRHGHPPIPAPTEHTSTLATGSSNAGLAAATLSPGPHIPTEAGTGKPPPSNSSTALQQAQEATRAALESIAGEPTPGRVTRMLEGTMAEPHAGATGPLKGAFPKLDRGMSPTIAQTTIAQPVLASSLVPGKATDANEWVQLDNAITAQGMLGTAQSTALSHIELGTGMSPPAIKKSTAAPRAAAGLPSQEVTSELDKGTSPPTTGASVSLASSLHTGRTVGPAAGPAGGTTDPPTPAAPGAALHAVAGGAGEVTPPFADPASASSARATFSPVSRTAEPGTTALPAAGHDTSQERPTLPAQPPAAISLVGPGGATAELEGSSPPVLSTAESSRGAPLPTSNDAGPGQGVARSSPHETNGTAGDGQPRAGVSPSLRATTPTPDTAATAAGGRHADPATDSSSSSVEVTAAKHVHAGSFPAPENTTAELVSSTRRLASRAMTGSASPRTVNTLVRMGTAPFPSTAGNTPPPGTAFPDDPSTAAVLTSSLPTVPRGRPSPRPFTGTASSLGDPTGALPTETAFAGGAGTMMLPFADPASASSARATFSPVSRTAEPGTTALPAAGHDTSQERPTLPAQPPAAISLVGPGGATAELEGSSPPVLSTAESSEGAPLPISTAMVEAAAGESSPARLSVATSLPLTGSGAGEAQIDVSPGAIAAPSSLSRYGKMTSPAADVSSFVTMNLISEAGPAFGNTPTEKGTSKSPTAAGSSPRPDTAKPWDASPVSAPAPSGHPGPAAGSPPPAVSVASDPAPSKAPRSGPVSESAVHGSSLLLTPSSDMTALVLVTDNSNPDLGPSSTSGKVSIGLSSPSRDFTFNPATATATPGMDTTTLQDPRHFSAPNAGVTSEPVPHVYIQHPNATSPPRTSHGSPESPSGEMWSHTAEANLAGVSRGPSTGEPGAGPTAPVSSPRKLRDPAVSPPSPSSVTPTTVQPATASEPTEGTTTAGTTANLAGAVSTPETARAGSAAAAPRAGVPPLLEEGPTTGPPLGEAPFSTAPRTAAATSSLAHGSDAHWAQHDASPSPDGSTATAPYSESPDMGLAEDSGAGMTHVPPPASPTQTAAASLSPGARNAATEPVMGPSAHVGIVTPEAGWDSTSAKGRWFLISKKYVTHPGTSLEESLQSHFGAELAPDLPAPSLCSASLGRHQSSTGYSQPPPRHCSHLDSPTYIATSHQKCSHRGCQGQVTASRRRQHSADSSRFKPS
ncbi:mucin-2-like [Struthio camelus]|uniref:mucin-2-like n=1 Tax=Struthio camelus TaxID=8801 RepID=UPI003603F72D